MHDELPGDFFSLKKHHALFMNIIDPILNKSKAMLDISMMWKVDSLGRLALKNIYSMREPLATYKQIEVLFYSRNVYTYPFYQGIYNAPKSSRSQSTAGNQHHT